MAAAWPAGAAVPAAGAGANAGAGAWAWVARTPLGCVHGCKRDIRRHCGCSLGSRNCPESSSRKGSTSVSSSSGSSRRGQNVALTAAAHSQLGTVVVAAVGTRRRRKWSDAKGVAKGKVTRKALALIRQLKSAYSTSPAQSHWPPRSSPITVVENDPGRREGIDGEGQYAATGAAEAKEGSQQVHPEERRAAAKQEQAGEPRSSFTLRESGNQGKGGAEESEVGGEEWYAQLHQREAQQQSQQQGQQGALGQQSTELLQRFTGDNDVELLHTLAQWVRVTEPKRRDVLDVLKELEYAHGMRGLLCKVMAWSLSQEWFEPNARDFTKLMDLLGRHGQLEDMEEVFAAMRRAGFAPDLVALSVMATQYGRAGRLAHAEHIVSHEMREWGVEPDVQSFTTLMAAYGAAGLPEKAEETLLALEAAGLHPTARTYAVLITAFGRNRRVDDARRVFDRMRETSHLTPDQAAYTALMLSYGHEGRLKEAVAVFKAMAAEGSHVVDDTALAMLVECHEHAAAADANFSPATAAADTQEGRSRESVGEGRARDVTKASKSASGALLPPPTLATSEAAAVSASAGVVGVRQYPRQAVQLVLEQEAVGVRPGGETYSALIGLFGACGLVQEAQEVFDEMQAKGIRPSARAYVRLYQAYARAGGARDASRVLSAMRSAGFQPNGSSYGRMLQSLLAGKLWGQAGELLGEAQTERVELDGDVVMAVTHAASLAVAATV